MDHWGVPLLLVLGLASHHFFRVGVRSLHRAETLLGMPLQQNGTVSVQSTPARWIRASRTAVWLLSLLVLRNHAASSLIAVL
jgi:hypothetical protein